MGKPKPKTPSEVRTKAPDHAVKYANNVVVQCNQYDVHLRFGRSEFFGKETGSVCIENVVDVVTSPQHFRAMVTMLNRVLIKYDDELRKRSDSGN